jgi:hypothetical protein
MKRILTLSAGLLFFAASGAFAADAATLAPAQAEAAMKSAFRKNPGIENVDSLKVYKVHGCVPVFDRPATDFLCVVDWHTPVDGGEDIQEMALPFRRKAGKWEPIDAAFLSPACPSLKEAQQLLRAFKKNDSLKVTGEIDEGQGLFSAERGMMRDKKGPLRIMCRFEVESKIGDRLALSYFWYENGKYRLDEVEDWFD